MSDSQTLYCCFPQGSVPEDFIVRARERFDRPSCLFLLSKWKLHPSDCDSHAFTWAHLRPASTFWTRKPGEIEIMTRRTCESRSDPPHQAVHLTELFRDTKHRIFSFEKLSQFSLHFSNDTTLKRKGASLFRRRLLNFIHLMFNLKICWRQILHSPKHQFYKYFKNAISISNRL